MRTVNGIAGKIQTGMRLIKRFAAFSDRVFIFFLVCGFELFTQGARLSAVEFEILDKFSVDGYAVLRGSADIPGGSFAVGVSTFVVRGGDVGIGTVNPASLAGLTYGVITAGQNATDNCRSMTVHDF